MFIAKWLRSQKQKRSSRTHNFRPSLFSLEERTLPSAVHFAPPPGPAVSLMVEVPQSVTSGKSFLVEVEALDASNHIATGYTGAVTFSLGTTDSGATLPTPNPYTFKASDHGEHLFQFTLSAAGPQMIDVSGTPSSGTTPLTASAATTVLPAPTLASLLIVTPEQAAIGVPAHVTIEALDGSGHLLRNFTGTVTLSTSDSAATGLPTTYTFTTPNGGVHTFNVTFNTDSSAGPPTTVTATVGSITNQASLTVYPASTVTHFGIISNGIASLGNMTPVTVFALNAANQVVPGYVGTVTFSSSDALATASATKNGTQTALGTFTYTFQASDNGVHRFFITFGTAKSQSLTVTDNNSVTATTQIWVTNLPIWWSGGWWW